MIIPRASVRLTSVRTLKMCHHLCHESAGLIVYILIALPWLGDWGFCASVIYFKMYLSCFQYLINIVNLQFVRFEYCFYGSKAITFRQLLSMLPHGHFFPFEWSIFITLRCLQQFEPRSTILWSLRTTFLSATDPGLFWFVSYQIIPVMFHSRE